VINNNYYSDDARAMIW